MEISKKASNREFGLVVGGIFFLLGILPALRMHTPKLGFLFVGVPLIVMGLLWPVALGPAHRMWMRLAHLMERIMTPIVMAVLFFGIFSIYALFLRMFGIRSLVVGLDKSAKTYWNVKTVKRAEQRLSFENQY